MKTKLLIIVGMSLLVGFIAGWMIGNSSFFTDNSKDLECLKTYKDIRENLRSQERQLAEREAILEGKELVMKYVENDCPEFPDLDLMYQQALKVQP